MLRHCSYLAYLMVAALPALAQPQQPNLAAQRQAMKKLEFLIGKWEGEATISRGPGAGTKVRQAEDVQMKLDGLVLLVEGTGRDPQSGNVVFNALATITYDDARQQYRFRSFSEGRFLDTELKANDKGFEWGFEMGPAKVKYTMQLSDTGDWVESGDVSVGDNPPRRVIDLRVTRKN